MVMQEVINGKIFAWFIGEGTCSKEMAQMFWDKTSDRVKRFQMFDVEDHRKEWAFCQCLSWASITCAALSENGELEALCWLERLRPMIPVCNSHFFFEVTRIRPALWYGDVFWDKVAEIGYFETALATQPSCYRHARKWIEGFGFKLEMVLPKACYIYATQKIYDMNFFLKKIGS